jgi:hypothetical protein
VKDRVYIMAHENEGADTFRLRVFRGDKNLVDDDLSIDVAMHLFADLLAVLSKGALGSTHPEGRDGVR